MSGGDPVEEGGQAVRTGFVQAMQTAAMTMNLLQRRGAEARSQAEFDRRTDDAEQRMRQNTEVHELKVEGYHTRQSNEGELHQLEKHFKTRQFERAEELHDLERQIKKRVLERGDADLDRRAADSTAERANKDDLHQVQRQNLLNRAGWEKERHDLDVEYKQLLIDIRRRAAGFTETLTGQDRDQGAAMRAAAAYAAADSTAHLSDQHQSHADAFAERLTEDADLSVHDLLDADSGAPAGASDIPPAVSRATNGLAEELNFYIVVNHHAQQDTNDPEPPVVDGTVIEAAIEAADVIDVDVIDGYGEDADPSNASPEPPSPPDVGMEP
ncbi:hypothetical protein GFY24_36960 [Nocardia sp. SYP-A9097]|uniref:hypothetical protein n=1 Tax=Nocardia sp. SYP-A9097 TaxID=2663237 RepID=UPI00129B291C|nr:hypothetical protein [Nocardia sp. SYP-A9097]MRH92948.1 hypothetical protein [Nocardia sp. SYP-A9097]